MPNLEKRLSGVQNATFVGGPLDGSVMPCRITPHVYALRAVPDESVGIRWAWYRLVSRETLPVRYEFVESVDGWPADFGGDL